MERAVIDRLPSSFVDEFSGVLKRKIDKENKIYLENADLFLDSKDEAARGRALEAKGRKLAYSDILNNIMGDKNGR